MNDSDFGDVSSGLLSTSLFLHPSHLLFTCAPHPQIIDGKSYNVRERSPYKTSFDLETLTDPREFNEFIEQVAIATATAHVRGTVSKSPGQFKHVIKILLAGGHSRSRWAALVIKIALSYRDQVLLDFECFQQYVETMFPSDN